MPAPTLIKVTRVEQIEEYYCGVAVALMILRALGVFKQLKSQNTSLQEELWEQVMELTTGPDRPDEAEDSEGYIEEFAGQQCYPCDDDWDCWATTPQAMKAVLNAHLKPSAKYRIARHLDEDAATERILKSIDGGSPAAVAVGATSHWVVVRGYLAGDAALDSLPIGDYDLNGVYVVDPGEGAEDLDMIPAETWLDEFIEHVKCGSNLDHQKHVVVID
jgi:hypothetical protein